MVPALGSRPVVSLMGRWMLGTDCKRSQKKFKISDFVVMPDHVHLQLTVNESMSIEKAMQLIKGGFSYRVRKELGYQGEICQRGFSEIRILNRSSFLKHREYIEQNPVEAGLVDSPEKYPYSSAYLKWKKKRSG